MIEFFVRRPVTTIMFVLVFAVLGIFSYSNILVEKTPKVDFPIVTISVIYPGATPLEVEKLVVKKIEDSVAEISEIKKIKSQSFESLGFVYIEFLMSADVNVKLIEVKDKVEAILNDLPRDIKKPVIEKYDPLIEPVMDLVLSSETLDTRDLYEYADKVLKTKLSQVRGVAKIDVYGGRKRQINVRLDPLLMKQRYISINEVIQAMLLKNKNIPAGNLEKGFNSLSVRFTGEFESVEEVANMTLTSTDGSSFLLKDIAAVEDSYKKIESIARYNGKEVVELSVNKASDGNAVSISKEIKRRLNEFREMLPKGMSLDIAIDSATFIINETFDTEVNILLGIILVVAILSLFTGKFKLAFIASIIIPTSIVSTFFPMWMSGFTINFLTLVAIATVLGTLIANAIVIIENVLVHLEHKEDSVQAAIDGTKEVVIPIIATTGTNLVVFMPIAMMGGIAGLFMKSFGLTVVYATVFSLLASFSLTPMLCALILKKRKNNNETNSVKQGLFAPFRWMFAQTNRVMEFLKKEYKYIFDLVFRYPKTTVFTIATIFLAIFLLFPYIESDFVPSSDENKIIINIVMPQGSTIERTLEVVKLVEKHLDNIPEKKSYLTNIGKNGVENAKITFDLVPYAQRKRNDAAIIKSLIPFLATITDAETSLERGGRMATGYSDVSIDIYGIDYDTMIDLSKQVSETMLKTGYFQSVVSSYKVPKNEIQLFPYQDKLKEYGLSAILAGSVLRASIYGDDSNVYKEKGEEYKINVELDDKYAQTFDDIKEISLLSRKGLIPISELGELRASKATPTIWHRDRRRAIRLEAALGKSSVGHAQKVLDSKFKGIKFPQGYGYRYVELAEYQEETNAEIGKAFLLAVILTYMLLCALTNSMVAYPVTVMTTVATSFIGVFLGLFFTGLTMNAGSMLCMVMLVGIVVNNAILLLESAMLKMKEGIACKEALWIGASEEFRVIVMTSVAIILGVLPQLWSVMDAKRSMGVVMIGGMLASIIFTFILVPVVFWYLERFETKFFKSK